MNLAKILTVLQSEPLLCENNYRTALLELFEQHSELSKVDFKSKREGLARSGQELNVDQAEIRDGIAIIPVGGPIGMGLGKFEKGAGAVDVDDISAEIDEAEADDEVKGIIMDVDSPGGMVTGTPELGTRIMAVEKPIYAFTRGTMGSGAFWLACACDGIFATPSAVIGSIGVYTTFTDLSRMADMKGIGVKVISSGPIKGLGQPGTTLSAAQEMFMRDRVMDAAKMFFKHVKDQRSQISDEDMGGQYYRGQQAMDRGFVDGLMQDISELEQFLRA